MAEATAGVFLFPNDRRSRERPQHNLPSRLTSFVGRTAELTELEQAISTSRLVTVTGAGGCGKTSLALEVARSLSAEYPDGPWFVDLAPLAAHDHVAPALAAVLGVDERRGVKLDQSVVEYLSERRLLIVLDNCEHLADACAVLVRRILLNCPDVTVLATSRQPLRVEGERVWQLAPLSLPSTSTRVSLASASSSEAVMLFSERAAATLRTFQLTAANAADVAEICARLDGLPLALELAAARVGTIPLAELARRLDDRFQLLDRPSGHGMRRQRTLEEAIAWSYELLAGPDQIVFRRLSVFAGGWDIEAAEVVCGSAPFTKASVARVLAELVERSLVVMFQDRYRFLESIHAYARDRLNDSGEGDEVVRRHVMWCASMCDEVAGLAAAESEPAWIAAMERNHDNIRAALAWCSDHDPDTGARIAVGASIFWYVRNQLGEGRQWLELFLARATDRGQLRVGLLDRAGFLAYQSADLQAARNRFAEGVSLGREFGDSRHFGMCLARLGSLCRLEGDLVAARAYSEEGVEVFRRLRDTKSESNGLVLLGAVVAAEGDISTARAIFDESLELARASGSGRQVLLSAAVAGLAALVQGDHLAAAALVREALIGARQDVERTDVVMALELAAAVACAHGRRYRRALRLMGACATLMDRTGHRPEPLFVMYVDGFLSRARHALTAAATAAAMAEGASMTLDAAMEYALAGEHDHGRVAAPLSKRELEVAGLVVEGLTAREIAGRLHLAERSVEGHVEHIRNKLGVRSRAQIASWLVQQRWLES
jgi:predicted ATPase/DNA-binding CsgD family transcriptional regulator